MSTKFNQPRSDKFMDIDGWIFNDENGKEFREDNDNQLDYLDLIKGKKFIFFKSRRKKIKKIKKSLKKDNKNL